MRAQLVRLEDLTDRDLGAWRELARSAREPNPFFEPDFVLPAWQHLGPRAVALLVAQSNGTWAACLPVHRPFRWRKLPLGVLAGWRHPYCFLGTPLVAGDAPESALASVLDRGVQDRASRLFAIDWLDAAGAANRSLAGLARGSGLRTVFFERFERAALRRRPGSTYLSETLRGHRRRELQRLRRGLARAVGAGAELEVEDRSGDPEAVEEFLRLEARGRKGRQRTALVSLAGHSDFFREVAGRFRRLGRFQLLRLGAEAETVAMKCNLITGDGVYCFKIAFDERFARYSPGVQLEREMVDLFHRRSELEFMDSCADEDNDMINRLWPDRRSIATVVFADRAPRARLASYGTSAAAALRRRVRERSV